MTDTNLSVASSQPTIARRGRLHNADQVRSIHMAMA